MNTGSIRACCHKVDWRLADYPDAELPEDAKEYIAEMIREGYSQGELNVSLPGDEQEYRGWWEIDYS